MATRSSRPVGFRPASPTDTAPTLGAGHVRTLAYGEETSPLTDAAPTATQAASSQTVTLQALGGATVLLHPLFVRLEQLGLEWFATSFDLALVGRGETDFEAIDDLRSQVGELFESLSVMRDEIGPHLLTQLAFLERLAGIQR
jgi:hypothetical protein